MTVPFINGYNLWCVVPGHKSVEMTIRYADLVRDRKEAVLRLERTCGKSSKEAKNGLLLTTPTRVTL